MADKIDPKKKKSSKYGAKLTGSENGNGYRGTVSHKGKTLMSEAYIDHSNGPRRNTTVGLKFTKEF